MQKEEAKVPDELTFTRFDRMSERVSSVVEPFWQSMLPAQPAAPDKLEQACRRIEAAAGKLEQAASK